MDDKKNQKGIKDIKKISTPETWKRNLINASLILTAYELMKYSLIQQVKDFFLNMLPGGSTKFKNEIKQLRNELPEKCRKYDLLVYARWFQKKEVLTEMDVKNIEEIWKYRNEIAHELLKYLVDSDFEVDVKYLLQIKKIIEKADIWWWKEFEVPTNPTFDQVEVKDTDIRTGGMTILDDLSSIALELLPDIEEDKNGLVH